MFSLPSYEYHGYKRVALSALKTIGGQRVQGISRSSWNDKSLFASAQLDNAVLKMEYMKLSTHELTSAGRPGEGNCSPKYSVIFF